MDNSVQRIQRELEKTEQKLANLVNMRISGEITSEEYKPLRDKINSEITNLKEALKNQPDISSKSTKPDYKAIENVLNTYLDFEEEKIHPAIINKFVEKVVPIFNSSYVWYINLSGNTRAHADLTLNGKKENSVFKLEDIGSGSPLRSREHGLICSNQTSFSTPTYDTSLQHKRRTPHGITKATTEIQEKENLIKRDFSAETPLTRLLTDVSEFPCADGKLYISPIMDCFNGEIVALEMRDNMKKELCIDTVKQLRDKYPNLTGVILHSDRGSQYTSEDFRETLDNYEIQQSLSEVGHCFDNARMESFFATLKKEKLYKDGAYKLTKEKVKTMIFRYVFVYYNRIRIYTANPFGLLPMKYREWKAITPAA